MALYIQHGSQKGDKVESAITDGSASGVVLGPRDEAPDGMCRFVSQLRENQPGSTEILFDPQLYAAGVPNARHRRLPGYTYYEAGMTRQHFTPSRMRRIAQDVIACQADLGVDRFISAGVMMADFRDPWSQINLGLAQESLDIHSAMSDSRPLLVSLLFHENALSTRDGLNEMLDVISLWECDGFYIVVQRTDHTYPAHFEEHTLANLLYLTHVLSVESGFRLVFGYADFVALPLVAAGADTFATGWHHSLRQYTGQQFRPATGGRRPLPRYSSKPLLNSIQLVPELSTAYELGEIDSVLSGTQYDGVLATRTPAADVWNERTSHLHHWAVLADLVRQVSAADGPHARISVLEDLIAGAVATYSVLDQAGVSFQAHTGRRELDSWSAALASFQRDPAVEVGL